MENVEQEEIFSSDQICFELLSELVIERWRALQECSNFFLTKNLNTLTSKTESLIYLHAGLIQLSSVWERPGPRQGLTDLSRCECDWRHFPQECLKTRSTTTMWSNLQNFSTVLAAPTFTWCQARLVCTIVRFLRWQECGNLLSYINAVNVLKW